MPATGSVDRIHAFRVFYDLNEVLKLRGGVGGKACKGRFLP